MNILRGMFRLSIVAAVLGALWASYDVLRDRAKASAIYNDLKFSYECGARISEDRLRAAMNQYEIINIGKMGCSERDFFASLEELNAIKNGSYKDRFGLLEYPPLEAHFIALMAGVAFILTNLAGLLIMGSMTVYRWVARGFSKAK